MLTRTLAFIAVLALGPAAAGERIEDEKYLADLVAAIESANSIVVSEHSFESDLASPQGSRIPEIIVYSEKTLTPAERQKLLSTLRSVSASKDGGAKFCGFAPHHTITLLDGPESISRLEICFVCDEARWNARAGAAPPGLIGAFRRFLPELGLRPDRDWHALAKAAVSSPKRPRPHVR